MPTTETTVPARWWARREARLCPPYVSLENAEFLPSLAGQIGVKVDGSADSVRINQGSAKLLRPNPSRQIQGRSPHERRDMRVFAPDTVPGVAPLTRATPAKVVPLNPRIGRPGQKTECAARRGEPQLAPFGAFQLVNGRPSITRPLSRWQNLVVRSTI